MVNHHVFMEQAVHANVLKGHLALHHFQVLLEVSAQGFTHPSAADAHAPIGGDGLAGLFQVDMDCHGHSLLLQCNPDRRSGLRMVLEFGKNPFSYSTFAAAHEGQER
jgi:hypothetical protein